MRTMVEMKQFSAKTKVTHLTNHLRTKQTIDYPSSIIIARDRWTVKLNFLVIYNFLSNDLIFFL